MEKLPPEFTNSHSLHSANLDTSTPGLRLVPGANLRAPFALSLADLRRYAEDWINEAEFLRQSPRTLESKRDSIKKLLWFLENMGCRELGAREIRRFLTYVANGHEQPGGRWGNALMTTAVSVRTIQSYSINLQGFCSWMQKDDMIPVEVNLMAGLKIAKPIQEPIEPFSEPQLNALLEAARHSSHPTRNEVLLIFMYDTGVRTSEVCGLIYENLELCGTHGQATVLGKGNKKRTLPFGRRAARLLWRYLQEQPRQKHSPVFLSDRGPAGAGLALTRSGLLQIYENLGRRAGLSGVRCSPHTMRHTFALNFLRAGGNTFTLQAMLGHTALHMTQRYVSIAQADIQNQHRQFSPADHLGSN